MYEEKKFVAKKINWFAVILKLLLLILLVLLVSYLIYLFKNKDDDKVKGKSMNDNLQTLKEEYIKYFNEENLPKYENQRVKVNLEDLIENNDLKGIYDINGIECSTQSSYGQITKIDNFYYNLKVYLKCKNEADSILTTVSKETLINSKVEKKTTKKNNNSNTNKNNTNKNNTNNNNNNNTNTNSNTNNTNTNTNINTNTNNNNNTNNNSTTTKKNTGTTQSSKTTTKSSKSSSSSSSSSSSKTSTTTTSTSQTVAISEHFGSSSSSSSSSSNGGVTRTYLYTEYKMVKYGDASTTEPTSGEFISYNYPIVYNKYCYNKDMYNCDVIAKADKFKAQIDDALNRGATEIYDHTEYVTIYVKIIDTKWSKTQTLEGYEYSGTYKDIYKTN